MRQPRASVLASALTLVAALALPGGAARAGEWVERLPIVERAIAYHGGPLYTSTAVSLEICSKGGCFELEVRTDGGSYDQTVTREPNGLKVRVTNDTVELWENGVAKPVPPEDEARRRRFVAARVYFPFLPFHLDDPGVEKLDLGIVDWNGRPLHKVRVRFEPRADGADGGSETGQSSDEYMYWFDPATGEVVYFAYDFVGEPNGLRFRRAVNQRRIGGILFFDQENLGLDGDGLDVGQIDPRFVADRLEPISMVELRDIQVRPLAAP